MQDVSSHRKLEELKAFPPDPRIRQVRGRPALEVAEAKTFTLDVDIQAWRGRNVGGEYDNYWDVRPGTVDVARMLDDGFVENDFYLNFGTDEATEEALVLELFGVTETEADGYRGVGSIFGIIRVEPLVVGALLSRDVIGNALTRLTKLGELEVLHADLDPGDFDNAYRYADPKREPPVTDAQVREIEERLQEWTSVCLYGDDLNVLKRLLALTFTNDVEAEIATRLARGDDATVRAGKVVLALARWARRELEET